MGKLAIEEARNLDAILNGAEGEADEAEEHTQELTKGSFLHCANEEAVVFNSLRSYTEIGRIDFGDIVIVEGPPEECDGYTMVPIKVPTRLVCAETRRLKRCYVELACFEIHETQGMIAKRQRRQSGESCFYCLKFEGTYVPYR